MLDKDKDQFIQVDFIEKELVNVEVFCIDIIYVKTLMLEELKDVTIANPQDGDLLQYNESTDIWENKSIGIIAGENHIFNELPAKLSVVQFQTSKDYKSGTLRVLFNGIKEKNITEDSDNKFSLPIDSKIDDTVEVNYIEKT